MTGTKYNPGKQEPEYNLLKDTEGIDKLIDSANYFSVSPEASKSMLEANEQAKQMAQK